jgi:TolA-binding protein
MVRVFAGSVEVVRAGTRQIVETGEIWVRPDAPPAEAEAASLHAFAQGWIALRELRDRDAVAAFDRAVDPVVAEDAAYWAAVASERSGDRNAAARRLHAFLARFPASVRAGDARRALARLEP